MLEFGKKGAPHAQLLCTNVNCSLNEQDPIPVVPADNMVIDAAKEHDNIPGHEGVVVYRGNGEYSLSAEEGGKVLSATGVVLI